MTRVALALAVCLVGCSGVPFLAPDTRTPADRARQIAPRCEGFGEESATRILSPDVIDSVDPAYSYVNSGPIDREARLRGARIRVKPLPGLSRETIARSVECHESRAVLGQIAPRPDDPYTLPDEWLDIDVESEGDGFAILVRTDSMDAARRALDRARRYALMKP